MNEPHRAPRTRLRSVCARASPGRLAHRALVAIALWAFCSCSAEQPAHDVVPAFTGSTACISCHPTESALWTGSDHDLAMVVAGDSTVLGDFDEATFEYGEVTSRFYRSGGGFWVDTDGSDGSIQSFKIAYTFGHYPLQQYLIAFPKGRYQTLGIAWDSRPDSVGGQRWFHMYPGESVDHSDPLHWTGREQNWNFQCAACHSTNVRKNYDFAADSFATSFSEIDVGCEACHGAGSTHVSWSQAQQEEPNDDIDPYRLNRPLHGNPDDTWAIAPGESIADRRGSPFPSAQLDVCGRCHSRRGDIVDHYTVNSKLLDSHRPALLTDPLYEADGQISEEVYVWGSFRQSRMYQWGVVCTDCHDAHSGKTRAAGNDLCSRCHLPSTFDDPSHHFHKAGAEGSFCVDCHMPVRTYMVVDPRRDHSLRIPRPDLTEKIGTQNACNGCHTDKPTSWAVAKVTEWYGTKTSDERHYGETIQAGRVHESGAGDLLVSLAKDPTAPGIVRATSISMLAEYASEPAGTAIREAASDVDPLVRMAAATGSEGFHPETRLALIGPLLSDSVRAVRIEAGRVLASSPPASLTPEQTAARDIAITEYEDAQWVNADRPESHVNLALVYTAQGRTAEAETAYRNALRLEPRFVEASVNLADLYRMNGRDADAGVVLEDALASSPDHPALNHAYGLLLVRRKQLSDALPYLAKAAEDPALTRFNYVYAVALSEAGRKDEAIRVARKALTQHPGSRELMDLVDGLTPRSPN